MPREMANKSRTPPPPRKQGPRRRETGPAAAGGFRRLNPRVAGVLVGGVVVVIVLAVVVPKLGSKSAAGGDSGAGPTAVLAAAGCTFKSVPPLPPKVAASSGYHADAPTLTTKVKWSTNPPSGGGHYGLWAVWDFYDQPLNPRMVVHNLEHGAVVIWWGDKVPAATVAQLRAFYDESPVSMLGTPYPSLGDKIALTAWTGDPARYYHNGYYGIGHIAVCKSYDAKAFRAFRDAYRGKGPEGIPESANKPGSGPNG